MDNILTYSHSQNLNLIFAFNLQTMHTFKELDNALYEISKHIFKLRIKSFPKLEKDAFRIYDECKEEIRKESVCISRVANLMFELSEILPKIENEKGRYEKVGFGIRLFS